MSVSLLKRPIVDLSDLACKIKQCKEIDKDRIVHYEGCEGDDPEHCYACQNDYIADADPGDYGDDDDYSMFADPGGRSSLRAENVLYVFHTHEAPTIYCPTHPCHTEVDFTDAFCRKCGKELQIKNLPCGNCGCENMLTREDKYQHKYQCNHCADAVEGYGRGCPNGGY